MNIEVTFSETDQRFMPQFGEAYLLPGGSGRGCAHSILHNGDFTNPVNQRGVTSLSVAAAAAPQYTIDRWRINSGESLVEVLANEVKITNVWDWNGAEFAQTIEHTKGAGKFTFAVCTAADEIIVASGELNESTTLLSSAWQTWGALYLAYDPTGQTITASVMVQYGASVSLKWAALYEGEYTTESLPEYQPKGYGVELAECLRYFYRFPNKNEVKNAPYGFGTASSDHSVGLLFRLPVPMRIAPTVTTSGGFMLATAAWAYASDVGLFWRSETNSDIVVLVADGAYGLTPGNTYLLQGNNSSTAHIDFSADL